MLWCGKSLPGSSRRIPQIAQTRRVLTMSICLRSRRDAPGTMREPNRLRLSDSYMDITKMLSELRSERGQIEEAIIVLQRSAMGGKKRRGRPPKWMTQAAPIGTEPRKRRVFSAATRKRDGSRATKAMGGAAEGGSVTLVATCKMVSSRYLPAVFFSIAEMISSESPALFSCVSESTSDFI